MKKEEFEIAYDELKAQSSIDDDMKDLWHDLLNKVLEYTEIRFKWSLWDTARRMQFDGLRTRCHDSVITQFNMISRYLDSKNIKHEWKSMLGEDRKDIGDFANYIVFREAVANR